MKRIFDDGLGVSFTVPERPTVYQMLLYDGALGATGGADVFVRLWRGALAVLTEWECNSIPEPHNFDLSASTDMQAVEVIQFVGLAVGAHMRAARSLPKN